MVILLAQFLSLLFNPYFLIFPVPYLLIVRQTGDPLLALKWTIFTALFIIAIGVMVYFSVKKGYFSDLDDSTRVMPNNSVPLQAGNLLLNTRKPTRDFFALIT